MIREDASLLSRFGLSPEEMSRCAAVREVLSKHGAQTSTDPLDFDRLRLLFEGLAPTGYLASTLAESDGGHGLSALAFGALVEALAPELTLLGNHSVQRYLAEFGSPELKAEFLPGLLDGSGIGAIAITEPNAGSDLGAMQTRATPAGPTWRLDGHKTWVTHGLFASLFVVLARTGETPDAFTRFIVPRQTPGLSVRPLIPIGLRHLSFAEVHFEQCAIPDAWRLGDVGQGAAGSKSAFPLARLLAALQSLRIAQAALEAAAEYAQGRRILGAPLARRELIQDGYARLDTHLQALRLLAYRGLWSFGAADTTRMAASVKAAAVDLSLDACRWALDVLGAAGLDALHPVQRLLNDARMMSVVDGTAVLNRLVAGRRALA